MLRRSLLALSHSTWLEERVPRLPFARRAVRRFMPGEDLNSALDAAERLGAEGLGGVLTQLGEYVDDLSQVEAAVGEYRSALEGIEQRDLDVEISVKPTQLGLGLDPARCRAALGELARAAADVGGILWIDMEASDVVEATLDQYRSLRAEGLPAGICLQAYLHRTPADLDELLPSGPAIRLVKGAYREPSEVALTRRAAIDERIRDLGTRLLEARAQDPRVRAAFGTHDGRLIERLREQADRIGLAAGDFEFQLLYGIRPELQRNLARDGVSTRVLISYGEAWFPWYVRRLAERPANVLFLLRAITSRSANPKRGR